MLSTNVLVLNRTYIPIHITSVRHALCLLYKDIARAVDREYNTFDFSSWADLSIAAHDETVGLIRGAIRVPRIIMLHLYDRVPTRGVRFSRLNVYLRDHNTCQYCGEQFSRAELNLDHVVPVSRGGHTTWENVVCSCINCNIKKGGREPNQARMRLMKKPVKPHWSLFFRLMTKPVFYDEWKPFLNMVDFSYWNLELKD